LQDVARAEKAYLAGEYDQAIAIYEGASPELKADLIDTISWAHNQKGNALYRLALLQDDDEAARLFQDSIDEYARAVEIKSDMHEAFVNRGTALSQLARRKDGDEANHLSQESFDKYGRAVEIKPDYSDALNNWGAALLAMACRKEGDEADRLFEQAREKLTVLEQLSPGQSAYNFACLAALQGNPEEAKEWLLKAREYSQLETLQHVREDSDLDSLRGEPWFKELLEELEAEESGS
jgi:predicted Zn-dependent protease